LKRNEEQKKKGSATTAGITSEQNPKGTKVGKGCRQQSNPEHINGKNQAKIQSKKAETPKKGAGFGVTPTEGTTSRYRASRQGVKKKKQKKAGGQKANF